jgi:hypothetical protein
MPQVTTVTRNSSGQVVRTERSYVAPSNSNTVQQFKSDVASGKRSESEAVSSERVVDKEGVVTVVWRNKDGQILAQEVIGTQKNIKPQTDERMVEMQVQKSEQKAKAYLEAGMTSTGEKLRTSEPTITSATRSVYYEEEDRNPLTKIWNERIKTFDFFNLGKEERDREKEINRRQIEAGMNLQYEADVRAEVSSRELQKQVPKDYERLMNPEIAIISGSSEEQRLAIKGIKKVNGEYTFEGTQEEYLVASSQFEKINKQEQLRLDRANKRVKDQLKSDYSFAGQVEGLKIQKQLMSEPLKFEMPPLTSSQKTSQKFVSAEPNITSGKSREKNFLLNILTPAPDERFYNLGEKGADFLNTRANEILQENKRGSSSEMSMSPEMKADFLKGTAFLLSHKSQMEAEKQIRSNIRERPMTSLGVFGSVAVVTAITRNPKVASNILVKAGGYGLAGLYVYGAEKS